MVLTRRTGWLLLAFGVWSWIIWPTFLRNIWQDGRSWHDGPTTFFLVHAVLTVSSLAFGTAIGWLGWRAVRAGSHRGRVGMRESSAPAGSRAADPSEQGALRP